MPFYRPGLPLHDVPQRELALKGWVAMPVLSNQLFASAGTRVDGELDFKVFDDASLAPEQMLYGGHADPTERVDAPSPRYHGLFSVPVGGRQWWVQVSSTPDFRTASPAVVWMSLVSGVLFAGLLAPLLQRQSTLLRRAQALAHNMTEDLRRIALADRLTGLPNRAAIIPLIQQAIDRSHRATDHHYAVLFLDLDGFKAVNDSQGHSAGDELLIIVAERLRQTLAAATNPILNEAGSVAARLGGDEFLVLLNGLPGPEAATALAHWIVEALSKPCDVGDRVVSVSASIGVAHSASTYFSAEEVVRDADTAMYEAKGRGRGQYMVFDGVMRTRLANYLRIENDLYGAIERREFFLQYQPIVSLATGAVESCEALVRWRHPELGVLSPEAFIGIAEETGFIVPLGAWVLDESLAQLARWRRDTSAHGHPGMATVSVNLSRAQLVMPELPARVLETLARHDLEAHHLMLEITENQIMENRDVAIGSLHRLRDAGVRIAIDDFGTGHSSLACLHAFPSDVLKVDRAFVANLDRDPDAVALLRSVTEMARTLGKRLVAEGIETDAQHRLLNELACELGQGYRFSRPLDPEHLLDFCAQRAKRHAA